MLYPSAPCRPLTRGAGGPMPVSLVRLGPLLDMRPQSHITLLGAWFLMEIIMSSWR
jgi:hypothetical protein